jgi:hypothetical protein
VNLILKIGIYIGDCSRVARFFLVHTKTDQNRKEIFQKTTNNTKMPYILPNGHKLFQMAINYSKWP